MPSSSEKNAATRGSSTNVCNTFSVSSPSQITSIIFVGICSSFNDSAALLTSKIPLSVFIPKCTLPLFRKFNNFILYVLTSFLYIYSVIQYSIIFFIPKFTFPLFRKFNNFILYVLPSFLYMYSVTEYPIIFHIKMILYLFQ